MKKRFEIDQSRLVKTCWFIKDVKSKFTFPLSCDRESLISTCNALNKLSKENRQLREIIMEGLGVSECEIEEELRRMEAENDK